MIRVGIAGYGHLGRGVEAALTQTEDMTLSAIFTRRPGALSPADPATPVYHLEDAPAHAGALDVLVLCSGSAQDLPRQSPALARHFSLVDSFDTHAAIPKHFAAVDQAAGECGHAALLACGWDPGLFSLARAYAQAILPRGQQHTFWGPGVSQGHSDALRRVPGVADALQYTVPVDAAVEAARQGPAPPLTPRQRHRRVCYVVPEPDGDRETISHLIQTMPDYFADYDVELHFVTGEQLRAHQGRLPHGGLVLGTGQSLDGASQTMELRLELGSNPAFTGAVLCACARAVHRLAQGGARGAFTMLDVPPALLSPLTPEQLRATLL